MDNRELLARLEEERGLPAEAWRQLLGTFTESDRAEAAERARRVTDALFGKKIYFRGIVEFTNFCRNDCFYCGIRRSNERTVRYRLTEEQILECCAEGRELGYRTFVLQGGEDPEYSPARLSDLVRELKKTFPDCAVTLSVGEMERADYQRLFDAGADRYLLRHETADEGHYGKMHPPRQTWRNRMRCLRDLKEIGYQTGCGFMVGTPFQTVDMLVQEMIFLHEFHPAMVGVGPFLPAANTPFSAFPAGSPELTLMLLSLIRLQQPGLMLPSTTALGTARGDGRQLGVLAGCNVVMPNLSPLSIRKQYMLYDNKAGTGDDAKSGLQKLTAQMEEIGYTVSVGRGDYREEPENA